MMKLIENARIASPPKNDNAESFIQFSNVVSNLVAVVTVTIILIIRRCFFRIQSYCFAWFPNCQKL